MLAPADYDGDMGQSFVSRPRTRTLFDRLRELALGILLWFGFRRRRSISDTSSSMRFEPPFDTGGNGQDLAGSRVPRRPLPSSGTAAAAVLDPVSDADQEATAAVPALASPTTAVRGLSARHGLTLPGD